MSGSPPANDDAGPNDPANPTEPPAPPPPLVYAQVAESLLALQSQLEQVQAAQAAQSNPAGAGPSRSYAQAAAEPEWRDDARRLERIARVAGHLSDETASVSAWLTNLDGVMKFFGVLSDDARVTTAGMLLSGKAQAYWVGRYRQLTADILAGLHEHTVSWQEFCDELRRRWPEHGTPYHDSRRALFDLRRRGTGVSEYTQRFTQLLAETDPVVDPLSATEVYLRGLPNNLMSEVEGVRPTAGWEPTTALQAAQQELQRLHDSNIVHWLVSGKVASEGGSHDSGNGNGTSTTNTQDRTKRKLAKSNLGPDIAEAARKAKVIRCMSQKLCFVCEEPLATCGHTSKNCPKKPKKG